MKTALKFLSNLALGLALGAALGFSPALGAVGALSLGCIPSGAAHALRAGIYQEVWTGEQIKAFRTDVAKIGWLNRIASYDQYVRPGIGSENDVIHLVAIGADPDVLLNNTTYPIDVQNLADGDVAITLDKYQTKATRITDDELHAITYDKMQSVIERHRDAVNETKYAKAIHAIAPAADSAATPVIPTSGDPEAASARRMITRADIIRLKKLFDAQRIPLDGRCLVLCPDHVQDLLLVDQKFADQYYNYTTGKISNLYGFEVYEYHSAPLYNAPALTKVPFGGAATASTRQASVAFYAPRIFKATGQTIVYPTPAEATRQEHLYNLRHYFICLPKTQATIGAIVSAIYEEEA
jgi:hypothetical protein